MSADVGGWTDVGGCRWMWGDGWLAGWMAGWTDGWLGGWVCVRDVGGWCACVVARGV